MYTPQRLARGRADGTATAGRQSTNTTRQNSPAPSLEGPSSSLAAAGGADSKTNKDLDTLTSLNLLNESLELSLKFSTEYTDENPLLGEPGSFKFSASNQAVRDRQQAEAAKAAAAAEKAAAEKAEASKNASTVTTPMAGARPPPIDTDRPKKRKKSKGPGSPVSPTQGT